MSRFYTVEASCTNCGWTGKRDIGQGTKVTEAYCPECACQTIERKPLEKYFVPAGYNPVGDGVWVIKK